MASFNSERVSLEVTVSGKHSSLSPFGNNYGPKKFNSAGPKVTNSGSVCNAKVCDPICHFHPYNICGQGKSLPLKSLEKF